MATNWVETKSWLKQCRALAETRFRLLREKLARLRAASLARRLPWFGIGLVALTLAAVAYLPFMDWNLMRGPLARFVSFETGHGIHIDGDLKVNLLSWTPRVSADGVRVANVDWAGGGDMARVKRFVVETDLRSLLHGRLVLPLVWIESPDLDLLRDKDGRENWHADGGTDEEGARLPAIQHLVIRDGTMRFVDARRGFVFVGTIASNDSAAGPVRGAFWLTGKGILNRAPFLADIRGGPLLNVDLTKPYPFDADIHAGATHIVAHGTIAKPFYLGAFEASATFSGRDLNDLYDLTGLAFPNTPPYRVAGKLSRDGAVYRFTDLDGTFGESDLSGDLSVDVGGQRPALQAMLSSRVLVFDDLAALFGARIPGARKLLSKALEQTPVVVAQGPAAPLMLLPDAPLQIERVRQMDAHIHYSALEVRSRDLPLRQVSLDLSLKNGVLSLDPFSFGFRRGVLSGSAVIDARGAVPVSDVDVRVTGLKLEDFIAKAAHDADPPLEGTLEARAKLHGTGDSIHKAAANASGTVTVVIPKGKIRKAFAELMGVNFARGLGLLLTNDHSETDLRCAVASFGARHGVLTADQFVFDTGVVLANGSGTIDLDSERVNLQLAGKDKQFRLFHVRAPVLIGGTLGDMSLGFKTQTALAQGGVALAVGAFLSPLAAILPFVDSGLAKDADCVRLLTQARDKGTPMPKRHR